MISGSVRTALAVLLLLLTACQEAPEPPAVALVQQQYEALSRAGASSYAGEDFLQYEEARSSAREAYLSEKRKWHVLRDYAAVNARFESVHSLGATLLAKIADMRAGRASRLQADIRQASEKLDALRRLSTMMNEGRLVRSRVTKAEVLLTEARVFAARGDFDRGETRVAEALAELETALRRVEPTLIRFADTEQIARWRQDADAVVAESARTGKHAIVVSKAARILMLYRRGRVVNTYEVGLGMNGSSDKLYEGDRATPEGQYRVVRKVPSSKYYRALLLNYPNDEDRKRFVEAKKRKLIPGKARIGGLVEIHGGGKDSVTHGCVSMENPDMDELFKVVDDGTPVAIVGALRVDNRLSSALRSVTP